MTKRELIDRLEPYDDDAMIYIPSNDTGKNDPVAFVCHMPHTHLPIAGIHIPPDVALLTGDMEQFVTSSLKIEDRMGDT
jgi:hypothetical protein